MSQKTTSLIEQALPAYDVNEVHAIDIRAAPDAVYGVLSRYRFGSSPLFLLLFGLRRLAALPVTLFRPRRLTKAWQFEEPPLLELRPSVRVAERPDEEVVMGLIGRFWQPGPSMIDLADAEAFLRFDDPTYARAAMNFRLVPNEDGTTRLSTETRVRVPDPGNRRKFRLYWALIGFFSGVIRVDMLKRIKRQAESRDERSDSQVRGILIWLTARIVRGTRRAAFLL
jgi:hypothetical protein